MGQAKLKRQRNDPLIAAMKADDPEAFFAALGEEAGPERIYAASCYLPDRGMKKTSAMLGCCFYGANRCASAALLRIMSGGFLFSEDVLSIFGDFAIAFTSANSMKLQIKEFILAVLLNIARAGVSENYDMMMNQVPGWIDAKRQADDEAFGRRMENVIAVPETESKGDNKSDGFL